MFDIDRDIEQLAQSSASRLIASYQEVDNPKGNDFCEVYLDSLKMSRPRSVGAEHVTLEALRCGSWTLTAHLRIWACMGLYHVSDQLLKKKAAIEEHLYEKRRSLFDLQETITLYDLTDTYFEGQSKANGLAGRGHSKEKRTDCPLVAATAVSLSGCEQEEAP